MTIKLSIEALVVIDAISRKGSFAAAAESLFKVPSALTYTVRKLEEDLGIKLFNRTGHRAELTEAGTELLHEGRNLLNAAAELECRVKRIASGVETELCIAVNDLLKMDNVFPILEQFYTQNFGTRIKLISEVYGGGWDALVSNRADIALGVPGDGPSGGGFTTHFMGMLEFIYAVSPNHPLAKMPEPLQNHDIIQHRSVSAADSSRNLAPRTSGILTGQDVLTVPDLQTKLAAQIAGLGVGYLPKKMAEPYIRNGDLVMRHVAEPRLQTSVYMAWRSKGGKSQQWLLKAFKQLVLKDLL